MRILQGKELSACILKPVDYEYNAECVHVQPVSGSCQEEVIAAMSIGQGCELQPCAFNGGWRGPHSTGTVYLFSFIYDVVEKLGLISPGETQKQLKVSDLVDGAKNVCATSHDDSFLCLDATFVATLVNKGLGIDLDQTVYVANHLSFQGVSVEAAWPLGAALTQLH